jgi:hypothetical protein
MRKTLTIALLLGLPGLSLAEDWPAPNFKSNETVTFKETVASKSSTVMSGKGLGYQLPPGGETTGTQSSARTVTFLETDARGNPTRFLIKYDSNDAGNINGLAGRVVQVSADDGHVQVGPNDGKDLSEAQRRSVTADAEQLIDSLKAFGQFSAMQIAEGNFQNISPRVVAGLLGLTPDQIKEASIKLVSDHNYELQAIFLGRKDQGGGEVKMSGTINVKKDWSSIDAHLENKSTQTSSSGDISFTLDTSWSLSLTRQITKQ